MQKFKNNDDFCHVLDVNKFPEHKLSKPSLIYTHADLTKINYFLNCFQENSVNTLFDEFDNFSAISKTKVR